MKKILLTIAFLLMACNNSENLKAGTYKMVNSPNNVPITLSFADDGSLNAKVVNIIMGNYEIKGGALTITLGGATMMMGPQKEMEAEQTFVQMLSNVKSYKMKDNRLELMSKDGNILLFDEHKQ